MKMDNKEIILNFLEYLKIQKNYAKATLNSYEQELSLFLLYLDDINESIIDIDYLGIKCYVAGLYNIGYQTTTIRHHISVLKSLFKYLEYSNIHKGNPCELIVYPKKKERLPNFLYQSEIKKLFRSINQNKLYGKRNYAILITLYATGMRVSELVQLKVDDIKRNKNKILILGKGNKKREVLINNPAIEANLKYITLERNKLLKDKKSEYLYINNKSQKLTTRGISIILNKISKNTQLDMHITPHMLRHSYATHMLDNGMDIKVVQELLGHENVATTQIYAHVTKQHLKNVYDAIKLR